MRPRLCRSISGNCVQSSSRHCSKIHTPQKYASASTTISRSFRGRKRESSISMVHWKAPCERKIWEITDYLKTHPQVTVVNLSYGLNMTWRRADNGTYRIYNLDFSDVIKCRNEIIPAGEREENIACDLNDFSWMDQIEAGVGAVFYAVRVFHYFSTRQVKAMVIAIAERFPGGRLVFGALSKFGRDKLMKATLKKYGHERYKGTFLCRS